MDSKDAAPSPRPTTKFTPINIPLHIESGSTPFSGIIHNKNEPDAGRCRLEPPCQQGRHGYYFSPVQSLHRQANRLGRYHMTEEGLKHDMMALRKGDIYRKDDFLVRTRAWYTAEIDRLAHVEKVHEEWKQANDAKRMQEEEEAKGDKKVDHGPEKSNADTPATDASSVETGSENNDQYGGVIAKAATVTGDGDASNKPRKKREKKALAGPTRIQPSRAAKRKQAEEAPPPPPKRTKKDKKLPAPIAAAPAAPGSPALSSPLTPPPRTSSLSPPPEYRVAAEAASASQQPQGQPQSEPKSKPQPQPDLQQLQQEAESKPKPEEPEHEIQQRRPPEAQTPPPPELQPSTRPAAPTPAPDRRPSTTTPETKGDYTLPPYDWSSYKRSLASSTTTKNAPEAEANAFVARVEQFVKERVQALSIFKKDVVVRMDKANRPWDDVGRGLGFLREVDGDKARGLVVVKAGFVPASRREDQVLAKMVVVGEGGGGEEVEGGEHLEGGGATDAGPTTEAAVWLEFENVIREIQEEQRSAKGGNSEKAVESTQVEEDSLYGEEYLEEQRPEEELGPQENLAPTPFYMTEEEEDEAIQDAPDFEDDELQGGDDEREDDRGDSGIEVEELEDIEGPPEETADPLEDEQDVADHQADELDMSDIDVYLEASDDGNDENESRDQSVLGEDRAYRELTVEEGLDYSDTDTEAEPADDDPREGNEAFDWNPEEEDEDSAMEIDELYQYTEAELAEQAASSTATATNIQIPGLNLLNTNSTAPSGAPPSTSSPQTNVTEPPTSAKLNPFGSAPPAPKPNPFATSTSPPTDTAPSASSTVVEPPASVRTNPFETPTPVPERELSPKERNLLIERELFGYEGSDADVHDMLGDDDEDLEEGYAASSDERSPGEPEEEEKSPVVNAIEEGSAEAGPAGVDSTTGAVGGEDGSVAKGEVDADTPGGFSTTEAVMDISPTLGKWILEDGLLREPVEVSGLRFLVDIRDVEAKAGKIEENEWGAKKEKEFEVFVLMM